MPKYGPFHVPRNPVTSETGLGSCTQTRPRFGAHLDAVPVSPYLRLSNEDFIGGGQFRLGRTGTTIPIYKRPRAVAAPCRAVTQITPCPAAGSVVAAAAATTTGKRPLSGLLTARAGCSNRIEPGYNEVGVATQAGQAHWRISKPDFQCPMGPPSLTCPSHIPDHHICCRGGSPPGLSN